MRSRSSRPVSRTWCAEGLAAGRLRFVVGRGRGRRATASSSTSACPTPQGADGSADLTYIEAAAARDRAGPAARVDRRQQVDRAGRLDPASSSRRWGAATSSSSRTPSSSARARRSTTSCTPTASSSAATTRPRPSASRRCTSASPLRSWSPTRPRPRRSSTPRTRSSPPSCRFVNAVAAVCEAVGADVERRRARHGLRQAHRPRVPAARARAGAAAASRRTRGRCCGIAEDAGYDFDLLDGVIAVNERAVRPRGRQGRRPAGGSRRRRHGRGVGAHVQGRHRRPPRVARAARSSSACCDRGADRARLRPDGHGPLPTARRPRGRRPIPYAACDGADVLVVLTEWDEFKWLDLDKVAGADGRRRRSSTPATCSTAPRSRRHGFDVPRHRPGLMARIVVTGGAGFLGSHLCDALLDRGDEVVAVDNFVTGSVSNIEHLFGRAGLHLRRARRQPRTSGSRARSTRCCTSPARRRRSTTSSSPIQTLKVGSLGTHNSLGLAKAKGARFLLASTSEVYGDPQVHPQPETYWGHVNPIGPRGVYDEAKRFAEAMTMAYHRIHGLDVRIVRIFNTYGPRMRPDDGRVVSNFIVQALARRADHDLRRRHPDPQLLLRRRRGRGLPRAARLATRPARSTSATPASSPCASSPSWCSSSPGSSLASWCYEPLPVDDPTQRRPDLTLARAELGWEPSVAPAATGLLAARPSTSARSSATCTRSAQSASRASASSRWARYQSIGAAQAVVERRVAVKPNALLGPAGIDTPAGLTVGLGRVPPDLAVEPDELDDELDQLADGQLAVGAEVHRIGAVVPLGRERRCPRPRRRRTGTRGWRARAPHVDVVGARLLRVDALLDERGDHVARPPGGTCRPGRRGWSASGRWRAARTVRGSPARGRAAPASRCRTARSSPRGSPPTASPRGTAPA